MTSVRAKALEFAKSLNCEKGQGVDANPPGYNKGVSDGIPSPAGGVCCTGCRVFETGNHPDTIFVKCTKQSGIGVDDVRRQILIPVSIKPFKYKYKVFIVDNADTLTPAAQNALLKTIEEPAPYGVFLFLAANTHNFLPTVLSRCVVKKIHSAGGKATQESGADLRSLANEIISDVGGTDTVGAFALYRRVEPFAKDKDALREFLNHLYIGYGEKIRNTVQAGQQPAFLSVATAITNTRRILEQNGNVRLALELMFLKMT